MRLPRVLLETPLPGPDPAGVLLPLPAEALRHLVRVLRLGPGAAIGLFDGAGGEARALLEPGPGRTLLARVTSAVDALDRNQGVRLAAVSAPRAERLERLVEQATELGASELVLLVAGRTPPRARAPRLERLAKIAGGACAQCGRARLPAVLGPLPLAQFLARTDLPRHRILLDRRGPPLGPAPSGAGAVLLVGPEGGFEAQEQAQAAATGFRPHSLGPLTLRVETALAAALARLGPA